MRFKDDSGDPVTEWSPWSERTFVTGAASTIFPLELEDVGDAPEPAILDAISGLPVALPGGANPPSFRIDSAAGDLLVEWEGLNGTTNTITNPPALNDHVDARLVVEAGAGGLVLAETNLRIGDDHCDVHEILVPALNLGPFQSAYFWVASSGYTYDGGPGQVVPDFSSLARGNSSVPWQTFEPGFEVEVFAEDLMLPVNIVFVPNAGPNPDDPFLYVTELYGTIKVVTRDGTASDYATNLLDYTPSGAFPGSGEQGLSGLAIDPVTGDLFASMLRQGPGSAHYPKVVRFSSIDGGYTAATQTTILDMPGENQGQSHFISTVNVWPDGTLLVHMGDGFTASTALNLDSYRGKILRMNLDGSPYSGNPMYNPGNGINSRDYIYAYGVRNPFGGTRRASDGELYIVENGPSVDRFAKVTEGINMGWNGSDFSMQTNALYNWVPAKGPVNIAFIQPETFGGSGFPRLPPRPGLRHRVGPDLGHRPAGERQARREASSWHPTGACSAAPPSSSSTTATAGRRQSGLEAGPDGLYMTDLYNDSGPFPSASRRAHPAHPLRQRRGLQRERVSRPVRHRLGGQPGRQRQRNPRRVRVSAGTRFCTSSCRTRPAPPATDRLDGQLLRQRERLHADRRPGPEPTRRVLLRRRTQVNGGAGIPFYDGLRCVGGADAVSIGGTSQAQGADRHGPGRLHGRQRCRSSCPGSTWHFQYWFRDPAGGPNGANLSDAISVQFQ